MNKIKIGSEEKPLENADESWINQQINRRKADGISVCVRVTLIDSGLNIVLSTPTCPSAGSGTKIQFQPKEEKAHELWKDRGLNQLDFTGGQVIAFLKQLKHIL